MKQILDNMDSATGWSTSDASTITEIDIEELRVAYSPGQLMVSLAAGVSLSKWFPSIISTPEDTIAFTICDLRLADGDGIIVRIWSGSTAVEYPLTLLHRYRQYSVYNPYDQITGFQIIASESNVAPVQLALSYLVSYDYEFPFDLLDGLKLLYQQVIPELPLIGTVQAVEAGTTYIDFQGAVSYAEKFTAFTIGDEVHQIDAVNTEIDLGTGIPFYRFILGQMLDGPETLSSYPAGTPVYLEIPIYTNPTHIEGTTPAISIEGGHDPEQIPEWSFAGYDVICTDTSGAIFERQRRGYKKYSFVVHGLYRSLETKAIIRQIFGQVQGLPQPCWTDGEKLVAFPGEIQDVQFQEVTQESGELQLTIEVKAGDFSWITRGTQLNISTSLLSAPTSLVTDGLL